MAEFCEDDQYCCKFECKTSLCCYTSPNPKEFIDKVMPLVDLPGLYTWFFTCKDPRADLKWALDVIDTYKNAYANCNGDIDNWTLLDVNGLDIPILIHKFGRDGISIFMNAFLSVRVNEFNLHGQLSIAHFIYFFRNIKFNDNQDYPNNYLSVNVQIAYNSSPVITEKLFDVIANLSLFESISISIEFIRPHSNEESLSNPILDKIIDALSYVIAYSPEFMAFYANFPAPYRVDGIQLSSWEKLHNVLATSNHLKKYFMSIPLIRTYNSAVECMINSCESIDEFTYLNPCDGLLKIPNSISLVTVHPYCSVLHQKPVKLKSSDMLNPDVVLRRLFNKETAPISDLHLPIENFSLDQLNIFILWIIHNDAMKKLHLFVTKKQAEKLISVVGLNLLIRSFVLEYTDKSVDNPLSLPRDITRMIQSNASLKKFEIFGHVYQGIQEIIHRNYPSKTLTIS